MTETIVVLCVFYAGFAVGAWCHRKPPVIKQEIKIDDKFYFELNTAILHRWGEQRGLVWMPKGAIPPYQNNKEKTNGKR